MITTYMMTVILCTTAAVGVSAVAMIQFAEAKWRRHPLARRIDAYTIGHGSSI